MAKGSHADRDVVRFWSHVDKDGPLPKWAPFLGPCWIWTLAPDKHGYGQFGTWEQNRKRTYRAHKWSYEDVVGLVPDGLELDHLCKVPMCVRPDHLEPVTHRENLLRGRTITARNAAVTHCPKGHEYDEENTGRTIRGSRYCRRCDREGQRRYHAAKKQRNSP